MRDFGKTDSFDRGFCFPFYDTGRRDDIREISSAFYCYGNRLYDKAFRFFEPIPGKVLSRGELNSLYIDKSGNHFYSTTHGLLINNNIYALQNDVVSGTFQNPEGDYWVYTYNNGLYFISGNLQNLAYDNVYTGVVKFSHTGIHGFVFATNAYDVYKYQQGRFSKVFDFQRFVGRRDSSLVNNTLSSGFFVDDKYRYYSINGREKISIDNLYASRLKVSHHTGHSAYNISSLIQYNGFLVYKRPNFIGSSRPEMFGSLGVDFEGAGTVTIRSQSLSERIFDIKVDSNRELWFGTALKMYRLDGFKPIPQKQFGGILFKRFDFFDRYMIGYTHDNHLLFCSNYKDDVKFDSLPGQGCVWDRFYRLDASHVLISSNNLYRVLTLPAGDQKKPSIRVVENAMIPQNADEVYSDGIDCYFFTGGSVTKVGVSTILQVPEPPKLFFQYLKIRDYQVAIEAVNYVPYNKSRRLSFSYLPLTYGRKYLEYAYSISNGETDVWHYTRQTEIELADPGFGRYTIKVMARTLSSDYCEPQEFDLVIGKPFWATWWFLLSSFLACALIIAFALRLRIKSALLKKAVAHRQEIKYLKSEFKAQNALMNPHFIFNALNNVQSLINKDEKRSANEYLRVFSNLVRQNMHNTSLEQIPLKNEIELVMNYLRLEKLRFRDHLNYDVSVDEDVDVADIMIPPLIIQTLVKNAIKHGLFPRKSTENRVQLKVSQSGPDVIVEVRDNGIGMEESKKRAVPGHQSFGLQNIKKRIEQVNIIHDTRMSLDFTEKHNADGSLAWTVFTITITQEAGDLYYRLSPS